MEIPSARRGLTRVQALLVICVATVSTVRSQDGFLSIDCGSDNSYYDNTTGIFWVPDSEYIATGTNVENIKVQSYDPIPNKGQVNTMRYFDDPRGRDCYVLPVDVNQTYLVRPTFFYGDLGNGSSQISFYLTLDNNYVGRLYWNAGTILFESYDFEVIYYASKSTLDVCLVRNQGPSFISALELRNLANNMYADVVGPTLGQYIYLRERTNCGASEVGPIKFWRYPDDIYDRVWSLRGISDNATVISNRNISGSSTSFAHDPDRPPLVVMQDAWVYYNSSILYIVDAYTSPLGPIYTAAYFQELDGNASATNVRGMTYYLNNNLIQSFNSSDKPLEVKTIGNIKDPTLNMSFVQTNWSRLRPILNAYEFYSIVAYNVSTTAYEDVSALVALQRRLNIMDWTGDPCLPLPFDWLGCSNDVFPRITNLSLANKGFGGNLPTEILNLTALTYLTLNNNSFSGLIPDLSSLVHLQTIYLQDNLLNGEIPSFLGSALPNLTQLNLNNNNLEGTVPSDLIKPELNFTALNNPSINCTVPACGAPAPPPETPPSTSTSSKLSIGAVVGGILGGLVALAVVSGIVWMLCTRKRRIQSSIIRSIGNAEYQSQGEQSVRSKALAGSVILLTLQEVSDATKKFSRKIGEGSFGPVYYGKLPNGQEVAVKVRSSESRQGFQEFLNEVELLSRIHHRNLVSLVGYCEEGNQQILIYVYVPNGTLRDHLYGDKSSKSLDWRTRVDIALNSARGLEYLHTDCNPRIIHRDVKSSNILLDENMVAKVADFGISKQAPEGVFSGVDTLLKGTPGYFDPEYFITLRLTQKSDVYSFGVVLLETISGLHPHVADRPDGATGSLIQWPGPVASIINYLRDPFEAAINDILLHEDAQSGKKEVLAKRFSLLKSVCQMQVRNAVNYDKVMDIVDPSLNGEFNEESMTKVITLAIKCIDQVTAHRPDMKQVVRVLTEAAELELFNEIFIKSDQDTCAPIAESKDEEQDNSEFPFEVTTEVPKVDSARTVLIPR